MTIRFDDTVVLVTGGTRGLGSAFALCLAEAGATVAINSASGDDRGVVAAIRAAGGKAVFFPRPVEEAQALVNDVMEECGALDAIVHNAGFLRDKTLRKMTRQQWDEVINVHLGAAYALSHAAWPYFEALGGGRLVFISSASGLYGNFGQSNYAAAKMGLYGLCRTIDLEGAKADIRCNCVAPVGATDMNSANWPDALKEAAKAEYVAPLVAYLAHRDCPESGSLFEASAGCFKKVRWQRAQGLAIDPAGGLSIEDVASRWGEVGDFSTPEYPSDMREALDGMYGRFMGKPDA